MIVARAETWVPEVRAWIEFGAMQCDFCSTRVPESGSVEVGELTSAIVFGGWTYWVGGLTVCPACRERMASEA